MLVWIIVLWGAAEVSIPAHQFPTRAACEAAIKQVPKSAGAGRCIEVEVVKK